MLSNNPQLNPPLRRIGQTRAESLEDYQARVTRIKEWIKGHGQRQAENLPDEERDLRTSSHNQPSSPDEPFQMTADIKSILLGKAPSDRQFQLIASLIDGIGFRGTPFRGRYLERALLSCSNGYTTSVLIERFMREHELRRKRVLRKHNYNHLAVTDISDFAFCPASLAIKQTFEVVKTDDMLRGIHEHDKHPLLDLISFLRKPDPKRKVDGQKLESLKRIYQEIVDANLIYHGHEKKEQSEIKPFFDERIGIAGIPDYIFESRDGRRFVVEEKNKFSVNYIPETYLNHRIQVLGYIFGIDSLSLSYGYVFYQYHLPKITMRLYKITANENEKKLFYSYYENARALKSGKTLTFEPETININKCFRCSVRPYCDHRTGKLNSVTIPTFKDRPIKF